MSLRDAARKIKLMLAADQKITMIFVDTIDGLTQEQIDSKTAIYVYLEI